MAPAIIAQHGMRGSAEQVTALLDLDYEKDIYHQFGRVLAERGYVVFAPNLVGDYEHRNRIAREATLFGQTILGLETFRISRAVDFLQSMREVDPERIGFWGLSMGGLMAQMGSGSGHAHSAVDLRRLFQPPRGKVHRSQRSLRTLSATG